MEAIFYLQGPAVSSSTGVSWANGTMLDQVVKDHQARRLELAGRNVHLITTIQSWESKLTEATKDGKILVANFSEPWSGPCRSIAPTYSELADKYPSLMFLTVDVDALAELSTSWDINATPTFFFLQDGRQVDKFVGADKVELSKKMAAIANQSGRF